MNSDKLDHTHDNRLRRSMQTFVWKYDKYFTSIVALLPTSLQRYSSILGHMTLPSIWAATLVIICLIVESAGYHTLALLGAVVVACIPIGTVLKLVVHRERPKTIYAKNMKIKSYSFPSSHTYAATIAGGYLALLSFAMLPLWLGLFVSGIVTILIVIIGISRIHVGAHYPTDVAAGWVLGAGVLYLITQLSI